MKNKEIIALLEAQLLKQDPKVVCHTLAGAMIDYHRMYNYHDLPLKEQENFEKRVKKNAEQIEQFVKDGGFNKLKCVMMNTEE